MKIPTDEIFKMDETVLEKVNSVVGKIPSHNFMPRVSSIGLI